MLEGSNSENRRSQRLKDFRQRLGKLSLQQSRRLLGTGQFGVVEAVKLDTGELVAIKAVKKGATQAERAQLQAERQLLQKLGHENIVKAASPADPAVSQMLAKMAAGNQCLVMEFIKGGTVRALLGKQMQSGGGKLYSDFDVCRWTSQLANALSYLHGREPRIAFRDLSAANVLLTSSNTRTAEVKLIDFGLAKEIPSNCRLLTQTNGLSRGVPAVQGRHVKAHPGSVLASMKLTPETGSYMYMAPEVTRHEPYDERCDIFALGCLLYDLWTRQLRYVALFERAAHANVLGQYAVRVASGYRPEIPSGMPEDIASIIMACWAQEASDRPTAAEVEARLKAASAVLEERKRAQMTPFCRSALSRVSCSHAHEQAQCLEAQTSEVPVSRSLPALSSWLFRRSMVRGKQSPSPKL